MTRAQSRFHWLAWMAVIVVLAGVVIFSIVAKVQGKRDRAWPITEQVVARLATDAGAADLYRKNPALAASYPTEGEFLTAVQKGRSAFGSLGGPGTGPSEFQADADPMGLRVLAKGSGGAWIALNLEQSDGTPKGHAAIGEGITFLGFAPDQKAADTLRETMDEVAGQILWVKYRAVFQDLLTEAGTRRLLQEHPALGQGPKGQDQRQAFLDDLAKLRPALQGKTLPATWKDAVDSKEDVVQLYRREMPPFSDRAALAWKASQDRWLKMTWNNGDLIRITVESSD